MIEPCNAIIVWYSLSVPVEIEHSTKRWILLIEPSAELCPGNWNHQIPGPRRSPACTLARKENPRGQSLIV